MEYVYTETGDIHSKASIEFDTVYSQWNVHEDRDTGEDIENEGHDSQPLIETVIRDMSFSFHKNEKVAIIGKVGSGKTSLFLTILQELCLVKGVVKVSSRQHISYAEQNPLIMSGTVRSNILFGAEFDPKWYDKVVKACALTEDFK